VISALYILKNRSVLLTLEHAQVVTSGIKVLSTLSWTRKERFTLAVCLAIGMGNILVKDFLTHLFDGVKDPSEGLNGFLNSIEVVISTPCESRGYPSDADEKVRGRA
jgi:hypothetical protein